MTASIDAPAVTKRRPGRPRNDGLEPGSVETRYCEFEKYTETDPETGLERKGSGNWGMFRCGRPLDRRARGTRCTKHVKTKETSNFRDDRGERSIKAYHEVTSWRTQQAQILSDSIWKQRALLEAHGVLLRELAGTPGTPGTPDEGSDQMVLVDRQRLADVVGSAMAVQETVDVSIRLVSAVDEQILKALIRDFGRGAKAQELIEDILDSQFTTTAETRHGRWIDRRSSWMTAGCWSSGSSINGLAPCHRVPGCNSSRSTRSTSAGPNGTSCTTGWVGSSRRLPPGNPLILGIGPSIPSRAILTGSS